MPYFAPNRHTARQMRRALVEDADKPGGRTAPPSTAMAAPSPRRRRKPGQGRGRFGKTPRTSLARPDAGCRRCAGGPACATPAADAEHPSEPRSNLWKPAWLVPAGHWPCRDPWNSRNAPRNCPVAYRLSATSNTSYPNTQSRFWSERSRSHVFRCEACWTRVVRSIRLAS